MFTYASQRDIDAKLQYRRKCRQTPASIVEHFCVIVMGTSYEVKTTQKCFMKTQIKTIYSSSR